jgi:uncharacterized repeat protein (TIGR01451 family)
MIGKLLSFVVLSGMSAAAAAAPQVSLTNEIKVVRTVADATGKTTTVYEEPKVVTPGDRLKFVLNYANNSAEAAKDFAVTNPMPAGVSFAGAESRGAVVSVDGGKTFGSLAGLKVGGADGKVRPAVASDVTHVRWSFNKPIGAGEKGTLGFEALVK